MDAPINNQIHKARIAFINLRNIWNTNDLSPRTNISVYNARVNSLLLYVYEIWLLNTAPNGPNTKQEAKTIITVAEKPEKTYCEGDTISMFREIIAELFKESKPCVWRNQITGEVNNDRVITKSTTKFKK